MPLSRRRFVASALVAPSFTALAPWCFWPGGAGAATGTAASAFDARLFPKPDLIRYDAQCYTIKGVDTFIFSLECPYPRCAREEWRDRFVKIRQAGFNTIDTYVFWNYHEREKGQFDFSDLEAFLDLAKEFGFYVIVRPGPYVDAEFERGGFPAYVIAERFPVRSMHAQSLATSKHWYDHVLPVIARHQITAGGSIILMQIENEIDFTDVPEIEQREYIRFLAHLAWDEGIQVPLISNVSSVVRDRTDPDMARIMDACDFYPRWSFLKDNELPTNTAGMTMEEKVGLSDRAVLASIRKMRKDEPNVPLSVAELGTGYYSKIGGKLSEDEEGADAMQINALSKTIIEQGVVYMNYYLGWGGSNRDWAAKGVTSTYDFAAPIREWGGLWDKYYNVKAVGDFLRLYGKLLTRSQVIAKGARSSHPDMTLSQRGSGSSAFVFIRADTDAEHHFHLTFRDPLGGGEIRVPQHGQLSIGVHAMKILPVQVEIDGGHLRYATAEVLASGHAGARSFLLLYDVPGSLVEFSLRAKPTSKILGDALYSRFDAASQALTVGVKVGAQPRYFLLDDSLLIALLPRELALHTWVGQFAAATGASAAAIPFITDAYLFAANGADAGGLWAEIDYLPGTHSLSVPFATKPATCEIDAAAHEFHYAPAFGIATLALDVPALPVQPIEIGEVNTWIERLDTRAGQWQTSRAKVLEDLGPVPFGYVKYRTHIAYKNERKAYLRAFVDNPKKVFINGMYVAAASKAERFVEFDTQGVFMPGDNTIEIAYELFGSTEFGETARMAELNGIDSLRLGADPEHGVVVDSWEIQTFALPMHGRAIDPAFAFSGKTAARLGQAATDITPAPAFTWCEAQFTLADAGPGWTIPYQLNFDAATDALFYLNGKFIGRYATVGPQSSFYLSPALLHKPGQANILLIVLAYTTNADVIRTLRIEPYADYSVRRVRVQFKQA